LAALTLVAVVALTIVQGRAASAHANYARSDPAPNARLDRAPDRIVIGFSEAPDPKQSGIDLLAPDGRTVASGARTTNDPNELALPLPALDPSTYLVAWHTVSAVDGDPAHGFFAFAIGPDAAASGSVQQTADASGTRAVLTISPARVGTNEYRVHLTDGSGAPLANVTRVRLLIKDLDRDLGTSLVMLPATGTDYVATGMELGLAGHFGIQVEARRRDVLDDLVYKMSVAVPRAAPATPTVGAPEPAASAAPVAAGGPPLSLWGWAVVAAAVLLITLAAVAGRAVRRR